MNNQYSLTSNFAITPDTIVIIDGSSFVFRAFYAIPNLTSPSGQPTGAIYGVVSMLKQMQKKYPTKHFICVFDAPGKTFRDEIHVEYKANRGETPEALIAQVRDIHAIVAALGIPVVIKSGIEADDLIGTLAVHAKVLGKKVVIATGDKDFAQLVDEDIILVNTMTNEILDRAGVINKFGVTPEQIVDYLSLVGDKVDNIPGVDKCGPKTAVKWLAEYGSLDGVIANSSKVSGVVGENLRQAIQWLATAKILVTIKTDIALDEMNLTHFDDLLYKAGDDDHLREAYARLGFKTWLKELEPLEGGKLWLSHEQCSNVSVQQDIVLHKNMPMRKNVVVKELGEFATLVDALVQQNQPLALLVVADNYLKPRNVRLLVIGTENTNYILAYDTLVAAGADQDTANTTIGGDVFDLFTSTDQLNLTINKRQEWMACLKRLFSSAVPKVLPNYKETLQCVTKLGLNLTDVVGDITLAHYIHNSKHKHNLTTIYQEYLNLEVIDLPHVNTKLTKDSLWLSGTLDAMVANCITIINHTQQIEHHIRNSMDSEELHLYTAVELPLAAILVAIENAGIMLDLANFKRLDAELSKRIKQLEDEIYSAAGMVFNISSPKQLQDVLFNNLKLSTQGIKKNSNSYSTDEESLKHLEQQGVAIATKLLEYRTLSKLLNTYIQKLPELVDTAHRVHTTFDQALVASGRLSSSSPNLQNIPIKSELGREIRTCFIAKPGYKLICADYSQIELRILAHISEDENLISAFNHGLDVHSATASEIFHKPIDAVSKDERRYAKTINFSLLYGKTVFGLAQELNIDRMTAKMYIDAYFAKYPKVAACLEQIKQFGREHGYVRTVFGRRIYLANINATNRVIREAEERLALNAPMQGTSADIIKIAMCNLAKWLNEQGLQSKMILQIHDELILEVPENEIEIIQANLVNIMISAASLKVKMAVDVVVTSTWEH